MLVASRLQALRIAGAVVAAGLFVSAPGSSASVLPIFTTQSSSITAGQKGVLDLHLDLLADPGHYGAQFAGGSVTLYSGNGAQTVFDLGSGGASRDFRYAFDYAAPGSYTPSFVLTGSYIEKHDDQVHLYDFAQTVLVSSSKCRFPCLTYATRLIPVYGTKTFNDSHTFTYSGNLSLSAAAAPLATPLPAALPLYATGLGLVALLAWRKRRRAAA